ncbi:MAG: DUF4416 family protein [Thermodesulfobacteriota bacterium]|nr:DUF4416 family protein [Thermodesulfobacteriota bacterium]
MARIHIPENVMLFVSMIFRDTQPLEDAKKDLKAIYGASCLESKIVPFDYTAYYEREFGKELSRQVMAFDKPVPRSSLADIKTRTNQIEDKLSQGSKRMVNLDPGLLSYENICLATTKPYSHRIYIDNGIWAEITLMYSKDSYRAIAWTYPDYGSQEMITLFNHLRKIYKGS